MSLEALDKYLTFLWVPDPLTMFEGIRKLPAGHYARWQSGEFRIDQYWDLTFPPADHRFEGTEAGLADEIRQRFCASVEQQMVSDVPIGAFLSAGLDSSSIVAAMARKQPVRTYTITFPEKYRVGETTIDDPGVPRRLARKLGCEHHEIVVEPDVVGLLPNLTWHMDEPTADPAIIAAYLVCREARKAGDRPSVGCWRRRNLRRISQAYRASVGGRISARPVRCAINDGANPAGVALNAGNAHERIRPSGKEDGAQRRAQPGGSVHPKLHVSRRPAESGVVHSTLSSFAKDNPAAQHLSSFDKVRPADFLNQMLYLDTKIFMTTLNLTYNDKMSMASSVEVRVPFLDREFAEFVAWNVKPEWKLKGKWRPVTKHIFREAMRSMLPDEVLRQPKAGFAAPVDYWLAHDLRPMVNDLLSESQVRRRGLFRPEVVRNYVDEHRRGTEDWSMQIWQLLTLEIWMQLFLDGGAKSFAQRQIDASQLAHPLATA